jgi:UDP-N-acetylmuramate--alanine ligase
LAIRSLPNYSGAVRRLQSIAEMGGITVMDDYAHHPTEVRAVLDAVRKAYGPKRLIAVFQPHQHSRTRIFLDQFSDALGGADEVIVPRIYAARDKQEDIQSIGSEDLVAELVRRGTTATFIQELDQIPKSLVHRLGPGDMVITMGAGDVDRVARGLGQQLREAS